MTRETLYKNIIKYIKEIYQKSALDPDVDLYRIIDIINSVNDSQMSNKEWLGTELEKVSSEFDRTLVVGGWYGLTSFILREKGIDGIIVNYDVDEVCEYVGKKVLNNLDIHFTTGDGLDLFYGEAEHNMRQKDCIVCTACEHIDRDDLMLALSLKKEQTIVALQSNNYYDVGSHINCSETLEEFIEYLPLNEILYKGELPYKDEYTRFMVIGR